MGRYGRLLLPDQLTGRKIQVRPYDARFEVGSRVWLMLPGRDRANAVVKWIAGDKIGAEFAEPISLKGLNA